MNPLAANNSAANEPADTVSTGVESSLALPLLLSLPDVSWPPPKHADRLPRLALEDVTAAPTLEATPAVTPSAAPAVTPASQVRSRKFRIDGGRLANTDLPWHERPAVREWIAKLASGGIIALVVLTLAGMFSRPWRTTPKEAPAANTPADTAVELKAKPEEPIIRQAQREPAAKTEDPPLVKPDLKADLKPVESFVSPHVSSQPQGKPFAPKLESPAPKLESTAPQLEAPGRNAAPLLTPSIDPDKPVRLPSVDTELNAPANNTPETASGIQNLENIRRGYSGQIGTRESERTATLRGIIEPPHPSRLR